MDRAPSPPPSQHNHVVSTARRTSPRRISTFQHAVRSAMDTLMREHGYSRERAVSTLISQLGGYSVSRPKDQEIFQVMQTYGLGMEQAAHIWTIAQSAIQHEQESTNNTRRNSKKYTKPSLSSSLTALEHFTRKLETIPSLSLELDSRAIRETSSNEDEEAVVCIRTLPSISGASAIAASLVTAVTTKPGMDRSSGNATSNNKPNKKSKTSNNNTASSRPPQQQPPPLPSVITTTSTTHAAVSKSINNSNNNKRRADSISNSTSNSSGERPPTPPQNKRTRRANSVSLNNNVGTTTTATTTNNNSGSGSKQQPAG